MEERSNPIQEKSEEEDCKPGSRATWWPNNWQVSPEIKGTGNKISIEGASETQRGFCFTRVGEAGGAQRRHYFAPETQWNSRRWM